MSQIVEYIHSLPEQSFESIKTHFTEMGCKVSEDGDRYMISIPNDFNTDDKIYLRHAVGSIFQKNTNQLLCFGFPKTVEITATSDFPINGQFNASEYIVGTLIRAYWDGSLWRLTTNGNMNAYESYWISTKSFGELFDACLSRIFKAPTIFSRSPLAEKLNTNHCYQFLISDPSVHLHENTKSYLYHVGTYNLNTNSYIEETIMPTIHKPIIHTFSSRDELDTHMGKNKTLLGYIIYTDSSSQTPRFKYLKPHFSYLKELIGNNPNMYLRYLECKYENREVELLMNFPALRYYSSWVEKCLSTIITTSYNLYVEKYIKKQPDMFINYFYRPIIKELHMKYNEARVKITMATVAELVHKSHPKRLHFILNGLKYINTMDIIDPTTQQGQTDEQVEQSPEEPCCQEPCA